MSTELWPYEEARGIINYFGESLPKIINLETGFGPSGPPHIGTFGEIARTMFVQLALESLGYSTKIIAFSDDMDGLRKVPTGFPSSLSKYLGKPVSKIPDPFGCHDTYSEHMNSLLIEIVRLAGADVEFKYSSEEYKKGTFNEEIKFILENYQKASKIATSEYSSEVKKTWFPFFVICETCGNIYTTRILDLDPIKIKIKYACDQKFDSAEGCGNVSTCTALNGHGKLPWKIDWAARWHAFDIKYEIYGKDLITSAEVSDQICTEIFNWKPPKHMFYELFLDEDSTKISKTKGESINPKIWLKYGSLESLYYLFFNKPKSAKRVSINRLPGYLYEVSKIEQEYYKQKKAGQIIDLKNNAYCFITRFNPPEKQPHRADFSFLLNLIAALGPQEKSIIIKYAKQAIESTDEDPNDVRDDILKNEIEKAFAFYKDVQSMSEKEVEYSRIDDTVLKALEELLSYLMLSDRTPDEIHNMIYTISINNSIDPKDLFRFIYLILTKQERGPRLGKFINVLGQNYVVNILIRTIMKVEIERKVEALKSKYNKSFNGIYNTLSKLFKEFCKLIEESQRELSTQQLEISSEGLELKSDATYALVGKSSKDERIEEFEDIQNKRSAPTKKLFNDEPYMKEFEAIVTKINGTKICLSQTCFYPLSGGQAGDTGTIDGFEVIDTQYGDDDIVHILKDEPNFQVGDTVKGCIDWNRRYKIMKLHSACHIMEYYLFKVIGKLERVGSFVNEKYDKSTYKYQGRLPETKIQEVNQLVNEFLSQNLDIERKDNPKFPDYRYWICGEITDPCGGTHPLNTKEIGKVQIKRKNGGSGKETVVTSSLDKK